MSQSSLEQSLHDQLNSYGYSVHPLIGHDRTSQGYLDNVANIVWLNTKLSDTQRIACLAHELAHIQLGHHGCQPDHIERVVDEKAALMLVNIDDYAQAERIYGAHPGILARELNQPLWVIEAFQRVLAKSKKISVI